MKEQQSQKENAVLIHQVRPLVLIPIDDATDGRPNKICSDWCRKTIGEIGCCTVANGSVHV